MSGVLKIRMERLLDERATVTKLHDDLLAHVESRDGEQGFTEIENEQISGYRARSAELDGEIEQLAEHMKREERSAGASKEIRAHLAGRMDGVSLEGDEVVYNTFAAYARDVILARSSGNIVEQIVGRAGGESARRDARERLARTPANTLSSNVAGLIPEQHVAQIFQVVDTSRPLVASAQRAVLERGQLTYPKVDTKPVVAVQSSQKTEAGNTGMAISMATATASTYLGGGDLSWQAIEWSTPNALDLWFRFAAADYALKTEQDAAEIVTDSGFTHAISSPLNATPDFATFMTAVGAGYAKVFADSGRIANTIYMAPDRFGYLLGMTSAAIAQFATVSSGEVGPLRVIVSRGMESGEIVVGDSDGLLVAETGGAPVQLRAVEPAIGGLEVGLIGAFEAVVVDPGAFSLITTAS